MPKTNDRPIIRVPKKNIPPRKGRKMGNDEVMMACQEQSGKVICRIQPWVYNPRTKTYAGMTGEGFVFEVRRMQTAKDVFKGIEEFVRNWGK